MKDRLWKPQSELELLQEHMRKEMAKWDRERSNFHHLTHLEKLKVDEKDGQLKSLEKKKENLKRNLWAVEEEVKQMSSELRHKKNMYTAKEVKRQVDEAKRDATKYKRQYDDHKRQTRIKIREMNEEYRREVARKSQQNHALEKYILQLETLFTEREEVESLKTRIPDLEEQNKGYFEQLQEAEKQRDYSHQMMQEVGRKNEWLHQKMVELEKACQGLGAQLKTGNILLNMDEREMVHPLRRAGEWIRNHTKTMERNEAWTKRMVIHVLTLAQQAVKLDSFLVTPKTEEEHQAKQLLKDVMNLGNRARKFL
ncbi:hypothetical protein V6N12_031300 [Hibiscus sabdariffa]|uniref:Uncharacterized protein n=1 Tax=Hibiscus sabdariffa TaxID=183260 RepID=A0ABR2E8K0_9ROSI